jgi:hypothetical protein
MKSAVDLNAFSIETNQIAINLGVDHTPASDHDASAAAPRCIFAIDQNCSPVC